MKVCRRCPKLIFEKPFRITETDTPSTMDMEDGDSIEVFTQQTGGSSTSGSNESRSCFRWTLTSPRSVWGSDWGCFEWSRWDCRRIDWSRILRLSKKTEFVSFKIFVILAWKESRSFPKPRIFFLDFFTRAFCRADFFSFTNFLIPDASRQTRKFCHGVMMMGTNFVLNLLHDVCLVFLLVGVGKVRVEFSLVYLLI